MEDGTLIKKDDTFTSLLVKAIGAFLGGIFLTTILGYVLPPIFSVGEVIFPGSDLEAIAWFFMIILFIAITLVLPSVYIHEALMNRGLENNNAAINIFIAVMIILTGLLLTYKGWFMIEAIPGMLDGLTDTALKSFIEALYWVGAILAWIEIIAIVPIYIIIQSLSGGEQ